MSCSGQAEGTSQWESKCEGILSGFSPTHPNHLQVSTQAERKELQLIAYSLRLLERKRLLLTELTSICTTAERELKRLAQSALAAVDAGCPLHVQRSGLQLQPVQIEITVVQQRILGQVPPLPELPDLGALIAQLRHTDSGQASLLELKAATWRQEIDWLRDELRSTAHAVETALGALRPMAQRFSLALGAAAPEPQSRGLGVAYLAQVRDVGDFP